uniref:Uncharacterized protein n=1 Tax=Nothoprocta perdicaria TaxID=30464 RepID=A0A8C7EEY8_NOTPE
MECFVFSIFLQNRVGAVFKNPQTHGTWVYLVTGGCGFIEDKIVALLAQKTASERARVFDSVAREEKRARKGHYISFSWLLCCSGYRNSTSCCLSPIICG